MYRVEKAVFLDMFWDTLKTYELETICEFFWRYEMRSPLENGYALFVGPCFSGDGEKRVTGTGGRTRWLLALVI